MNRLAPTAVAPAVHPHALGHAHDHLHGHAHHPTSAALAPRVPLSWLLRSAAWRAAWAVLVCAGVVLTMAWAMAAQG